MPLDKIWMDSQSLAHKMASLTFKKGVDDNQTNKKSKKKDKDENSHPTINIGLDDTFKFFSKVFAEK